jgi:hypothetical protein
MVLVALHIHLCVCVCVVWVIHTGYVAIDVGQTVCWIFFTSIMCGLELPCPVLILQSYQKYITKYKLLEREGADLLSLIRRNMA